MKKFKSLLLILLLIPCCFLFTACNSYSENIVQVEKMYNDEIGTVYKLIYSDGSSSYIVDKDIDATAQKVDLEYVYNVMTENGYTGTYLDFIDEYLNINVSVTDTQLAVAKAINSVVSVYTDSGSAGSGVIYKMDDDYTYIVTNYHVVYNSNTYSPESTLYAYMFTDDVLYSGDNYSFSFGGDVLTCSYIGGSANYDIAVLRVNTADVLNNNIDACAVTIAENYYLAEDVIAIGNPNAEGISVTSGIVSVLSETIITENAKGDETQFHVMRIDAGVNPGNSGGGLFNSQGELIGIVNAKRNYNNDGTMASDIAYALPIDDVSVVADNIISKNKATNKVSNLTSIKLGISYVEEGKQIVSVNGEIMLNSSLVVQSVTKGGIADNLNIQAGDIIAGIKINNETYYIKNPNEIKLLLLNVNVGDEIALLVDVNDAYNYSTYTVLQSDLVNVD